MEGASMIEGLLSAGAFVRSSSIEITDCVVARLPDVRMVINRSPGFSNVNSLRAVEMLSTPALVRVSEAKTRPFSRERATQYVNWVSLYWLGHRKDRGADSGIHPSFRAQQQQLGDQFPASEFLLGRALRFAT